MSVAVHHPCDLASHPRNFLLRFPHELLRGKAHGIGATRTRAPSPILATADIPAASHDASVQEEIPNHTTETRALRGLACLANSRCLQAVRQIGSVPAIMCFGRTSVHGGCKAVFKSPARPCSEAPVRSAPRRDPTRRRKRASVGREAPNHANRPGGCALLPRRRCAAGKRRAAPPEPRRQRNRRMEPCNFPLSG